MIEHDEVRVETTFVMIKPDAIERGLIGKIISRLEDKYLRLVRIEMRFKNSDWLKLQYGHLPEEVFRNLEEMMLSAPLVGIVVMGPEAVSVVRRMVGATDSSEADPDTIRGRYGTLPKKYNLVHASDSVEAAEDEIEWFYNIRTDDFE